MLTARADRDSAAAAVVQAKADIRRVHRRPRCFARRSSTGSPSWSSATPSSKRLVDEQQRQYEAARTPSAGRRRR